jgi:hypothetical protein
MVSNRRSPPELTLDKKKSAPLASAALLCSGESCDVKTTIRVFGDANLIFSINRRPLSCGVAMSTIAALGGGMPQAIRHPVECSGRRHLYFGLVRLDDFFERASIDFRWINDDHTFSASHVG